MLFNFENVYYEIGAEEILKDVSFSVADRDKIGIIGPNGAGKTTLLKLFAEEIEPSKGAIYTPSAKNMAYVAQNSGLNSNETVIEEFMKPFDELVRMEMRIDEIEKSPDGEKEKLAALYDRFKAMGGLTYRSRISAVLAGLGFSEDMKNLQISSLSEGQKTRLALGRALVVSPDILLLDEPTNHLDVDAVVWLENDLKKYNGTLIIVSHDRTLLNNVTNRTLFIEFNRVDSYPFAYEKATEVREADKKYQESCYIKQQHQIEKINAFIKQQQQWNRERNIIAAESRMKQLEKMVMIDKPQVGQKSAAIKFECEDHGCKDVLLVKDLSFSYPGKILFENLNLYITRGERVFISGKNGCGKSTFLKVITGELEQNSGTYKMGENLTFSYYRQNMDNLNPENTVFDEIWDHANKDATAVELKTVTEIRTALGAFNFTGEDVFKKISDLSGGEKARVSLLKICYDKSSLLILDEPTNHLDIQTRETLEKAIQEFKGTVIAVSHDRYFVSKLATKVFDMTEFCPSLEVKEKSTKNKEDYFKAKEAEAAARKKKSAIERLEKKIGETEARIGEIEAELSKPEVSSDYGKILPLCEEKDKLAKDLEELYETYFGLTEE